MGETRKIIISIFLTVLILVVILMLFMELFYDEVDIDYLTSIEEHNVDIPGTWFIITSEDQRGNWVNEGLNLPSINFNRNFMIVSHHKIFNIRYKKGDTSCGSPYGQAEFNLQGSKEGLYYIYLMEKVWLLQGTG